MAKKIITAQIIIDPNPDEYRIEALTNDQSCSTPRILVLQNFDTQEVEVLELPFGKNSLDFIEDKELNGDNFVIFTEDDLLYEEPTVADKTEANIVLNKLKRTAKENLDKLTA